MSEVHVNITIDNSGSQVVFHNPARPPLAPGAGQTITQVKDASGKVISTSGQVPGTSVVHEGGLVTGDVDLRNTRNPNLLVRRTVGFGKSAQTCVLVSYDKSVHHLCGDMFYGHRQLPGRKFKTVVRLFGRLLLAFVILAFYQYIIFRLMMLLGPYSSRTAILGPSFIIGSNMGFWGDIVGLVIGFGYSRRHRAIALR